MENAANNSSIAADYSKMAIQIISVFLGAFLALWFNRILDARKASRDYATKLFDVVRDDVRQSMISSAEYWAGNLDQNRKIILESNIRVFQSEIISGSRLLDDHCSHDDASSLDVHVRNYIKHLTGGNFESRELNSDKGQIDKITFFGGKLRAELARLRSRQIN